jgi:hypothetical protein
MSEPLAEFSDYESLRRAIVAAKDKRDISFSLLDEITGAPSGYYSRVLGPKPPKRMSINSLIWVLGGLGVKAVLVEDPAALAKVRGRFVARDRAHLAAVQNGVVHIRVERAQYREMGRKGGANSRKNLGKRKVRQLAKKAAQARWGKVKRKGKEQARRARQRRATHKARRNGNHQQG